MTDEDEAELHRMCEALRQIARDDSISETQREVVKKAAIGVSIAFIHGLRDDVERQYSALGRLPTEDEKNLMRALGIDPDDTSTI